MNHPGTGASPAAHGVGSPYDEEFFAYHEQASLHSAREIVPILLRLIKPSTVVDVGCGRGTWLRVFQDHGVREVRGFDGSHIDRTKLLIDPTHYTPADLAALTSVDGTYDLALCLEVAEHLPPGSSAALVRALTAAAPLVLFSAAIPGQGGTAHVNEQWPWFWDRLFADLQFQRLDPIRREIRENQRVKWWYRQNIVLYASAAAVESTVALQEEATLSASTPFEWVHLEVLRRQSGPLALLNALPGALAHSARSWLRSW